MKYANFGKRLLAFIIDQVIIIVFIGIIIKLANVSSDKISSIIVGWFTIAGWLYYAMQESSDKQATIGKQLFSLKVTDLNGKKISFKRASGRFFGKYVCVLTYGIGFLMILFTKRRQGLHDMMAKTMVTSTGEEPEAVQTRTFRGAAALFCPKFQKTVQCAGELINKEVVCPLCEGVHTVASAGTFNTADGISSAPIINQSKPQAVTLIASFSERVKAWMVDFIIMFVVASVLSVVFILGFPDWQYELTRFPKEILGITLTLIFGLFFEIVPTAVFGQSIGKKLTGLQVVSDKQGVIGYTRSFFRFLLKNILSQGLFFIGNLWALSNKQRKTWHDLIINTHVNKLSFSDRKACKWMPFFKTNPGRLFLFTPAAGVIIIILCLVLGWGREKTQWIHRAAKLQQESRYQDALTEYNKLIETFPMFALSYNMRGMLYLSNLGDIDRAIQYLETAITLNSRDSQALTNLSLACFAKVQMLGEDSAFKEKKDYLPQPQIPAEPEKIDTGVRKNYSSAVSKREPEHIQIRPDSSLPLDLHGKTPEQASKDLRKTAEARLRRALAIDPNNDASRALMLKLKPDAKLPPKRPCFVATAAFGNYDSFEVHTLWDFRERYLLKTSWGKEIVKFYYAYGPYLAHGIEKSLYLKAASRILLQPFVYQAWILLNPLCLILFLLPLILLCIFWSKNTVRSQF